jgi:RHH-type transcriptional regulator, rel operon repressor / antitoxin RelB
MSEINAEVPDELVAKLDRAAERLKKTRSDIVREAIESHLDDIEDLRLGLEALHDPNDPILEWTEVRAGLLAKEAG